MNAVFSYGTLVHKFSSTAIQIPALLKGDFEIDNSGMFPELRKANFGHKKSIVGYLLFLDDEQLKSADRYESDLYERERFTVHTNDGDFEAWVYISK
jgi:gamma-glutamylcyclotransferase (GGCT)/AIG2-like uncharacterized protein YtfP